jgi:hypothetical protein
MPDQHPLTVRALAVDHAYSGSLPIASPRRKPYPKGKRMHLRNTFFGFVFVGALLSLKSPVNAQAYDGRWDGFYACGQHALKPENGPFKWSIIRFDVQSGAISGRHEYNTRSGIPTTAFFTGRVDQAGNIKLDVIARLQDGREDFHQTLIGRAGSPGSADLTGTMLNDRGQSVRNCQLTLSLVVPAQPPVVQATPATAIPATTTAQDLNQGRQRLKAQKKLAEEEAARQQEAKVERQRLIAEAETAKQRAVEVQQQLDGLRAAQEKAAKEEAEKHQEVQSALDRQREETASLRQEAGQRAASQERQAAQLQQLNQTQQQDRVTAQTRNQETNQRVDDINGFLRDMILPVFERPDDWVLHKAAIPVQQQQFCRIVNQFGPDLEQVKQVRNEIRSNMLYRDREKDLEALLPHGRFENWVLHVIAVTQAADGSAAILVQPPCEVMLASDACQKNGSRISATIKKDTAPFRELEKVGHNDWVVVSGTILYLSQEDQTKELPQYALYKPGEYCSESDGTKIEEVFVTGINYLVQLR